MKKFLKIGCLVVILFAAFFFVLFLLMPDSTGNYEPRTVQTADTIPPKPKLNDSIWSTIVPKDFRANVDEFQKTAFYFHPLAPRYTNVNWIYPYIGKAGDRVYLRIKFQYKADDWLFINKVQFLIDGEVVDFSHGAFKRDHSGGEIWEWADLEVNPAVISVMKAIVASKSTKVRYTGNTYHKDREITAREKKAMKETLEVYEKARQFR